MQQTSRQNTAASFYHERFGAVGQTRVYGKSAALLTEVTETKAGLPTVSLEFAKGRAGGRYLWAEKLSIQLTIQELPAYLAALVEGSHLAISNHGGSRDKGMEVRRNPEGGRVLVGLRPGEGLAVPATRADTYWLIAQAASALQGCHPSVSALGIIRSVSTD